jgi:hypothetical protein
MTCFARVEGSLPFAAIFSLEPAGRFVFEASLGHLLSTRGPKAGFVALAFMTKQDEFCAHLAVAFSVQEVEA